jgi:GntR family transcriptional regulator, transcriptional repressor for pyruvate dehydrogenase complex
LSQRTTSPRRSAELQQPPFSKFRKRRAYEDVVEQIERAILTGKLKIRDRLPSERDLIGQFGVSRATIREALRVLQSRGLVDVRHGDPLGPVVKANPGEGVTNVLSSLYRADQLPLVDVVQFRMFIEGTAAALAAHAPKSAIAGIREAYDGMRTADTWDSLFESDVLFHRRIADASGNSLFALIVDALHQFNSIKIWQSGRSLSGAREATLEAHGKILQAIEDGRSNEAASLCRRFLQRAYEPLIREKDRARLTLADELATTERTKIRAD